MHGVTPIERCSVLFVLRWSCCLFFYGDIWTDDSKNPSLADDAICSGNTTAEIMISPVWLLVKGSRVPWTKPDVIFPVFSSDNHGHLHWAGWYSYSGGHTSRDEMIQHCLTWPPQTVQNSTARCCVRPLQTKYTKRQRRQGKACAVKGIQYRAQFSIPRTQT